MKNLDDMMGRFVDMCRKAGFKVTHQRMEIYRRLAATDEHPDAEKIYTGVRRNIPSISLDTVYRNLRMLEANGFIAMVKPMGHKTQFDANMDRHHHFVCRKCGAVQDFYSADLDSFMVPGAASALGKVENMQVKVRGICRACCAKTKKKNKRGETR